MDSIRAFRDEAKIGKKMLIELVGSISPYKEIIRKEVKDFSGCDKNCLLLREYHRSPDAFISNNPFYASCCEEYCRKHISIQTEVVYRNEANNYKLSNQRFFLSKSQILQFLLYHFLAYGAQGLVANITDPFIADILGCSVKTVKNNNQRFLDLGLILISHKYQNKTYNLIIKNYPEYHATREEGGHGYMYLTKETFYALLKTDINSLRTAIRSLLKHDNESFTEQEASTYSYKEVQRFLPPHLNYRRATERVIRNLPRIFDIEMKPDSFKFKLRDEFNPKIVREKSRTEYQEAFKAMFLKTNSSLVNNLKLLEDLSQMSIEYSFDSVSSCLESIQHKRDIASIDNLAGMIRTAIKHSIVRIA